MDSQSNAFLQQFFLPQQQTMVKKKYSYVMKKKPILNRLIKNDKKKELLKGTTSQEKENILEATASERMVAVESSKKKRFQEGATSKKMIKFSQGMASEKTMNLEEEMKSQHKVTPKNKETLKEKECHGKMEEKETLKEKESDSVKAFQEGMTFEAKVTLVTSAILLTTKSPAVAYSCSAHRVFPPLDPLVEFFHDKAMSLVEDNPNVEDGMKSVLRSILTKCASNSSDMCIRAFLHVLYANPNRNKEELQSLCEQPM
ncbi:hypothetical protein GUJ93_ZPchr0016g2576 [Zizania palustris]|uniref:Uncharacterized protein n=1 Tax=Zizania palustris TaxID=103762 RepID=A0A8J5W731_ZIZPA|nr:hypothetical protein GUJ93_ZPchr0016g2576 [Zizania palustris]